MNKQINQFNLSPSDLQANFVFLYERNPGSGFLTEKINGTQIINGVAEIIKNLPTSSFINIQTSITNVQNNIIPTVSTYYNEYINKIIGPTFTTTSTLSIPYENLVGTQLYMEYIEIDAIISAVSSFPGSSDADLKHVKFKLYLNYDGNTGNKSITVLTALTQTQNIGPYNAQITINNPVFNSGTNTINVQFNNTTGNNSVAKLFVKTFVVNNVV